MATGLHGGAPACASAVRESAAQRRGEEPHMEGKGGEGSGRSVGEETRHGVAWSLLGVAVALRRAPRPPPSCFVPREEDDKAAGWAGPRPKRVGLARGRKVSSLFYFSVYVFFSFSDICLA